jgi:hypothetical protein
MADDPTEAADRRLQEALDARGARDPREFYRERLRDLKSSNPEGYAKAVAYYKDRLLPDVASGDIEPIAAWVEYGRRLAEAVSAGHAVSIDRSGKSTPYEAPPAPDALVLHIPDGKGGRALLVGLPTELTSAQRATYTVLVEGKQRLR